MYLYGDLVLLRTISYTNKSTMLEVALERVDCPAVIIGDEPGWFTEVKL